MEKDNTRAQRFARSFDPLLMDQFQRERGAWHETPDEVRRGMARGRRDRARLAWVRSVMPTVLTPCEQRYVILYYFEHKTFAEVGVLCGTNASSACRGVQRGIRKLKQAKEADPLWHDQ